MDSTKIFAYLTIPEDAKLGVTAHELGHLVFGWPDLYDTDNTSEGIGNWCLMASGSWGLGGDRPMHPSAWCKSTQGWVNVVAPTTNADVTINDVKTGRTAYRLWKDGGGGNEYFLVENRQQAGYDASLPGPGPAGLAHRRGHRRQQQREPLQGRADAGGRAAPPGDQRQPR